MIHVTRRAAAFYRSALVAVLSVLAIKASAAEHSPKPLAETSVSSIEYPSVAAALTALRSRKDISFRSQDGWTIAIDEKSRAIWSFAPESYSAYPAVVKRQVFVQGSGSRIDMSVLCEAEKPECDQLVKTFAQMNGFELPS